MFRGVTILNLDAKGRMAMPSKYRERLQQQGNGELVVTLDMNDPCLLIYPVPEWEDIERKLVRLPSLNQQAMRIKRLLLGHASEVELDSHGRILLPPALRELVKLDKRIILLGQGNKFEVWDEQTWNERREQWLDQPVTDEGLSDELESLSL
ncbi:MAG: division/cell wall cluster transcriptional repressor MraZ [Gammaproteobacteria bacterium]|nr:division/cell wall cluster transcriptional repressor MraZ [Gammaproteobacteria bacterium]